MLFLVTAEDVRLDPFASDEIRAKLLQEKVLPGLKKLAELEQQGVVRGGLIAGTRDGAFVLEAEGPDEVDRILLRLSLWHTMDWKIVPLQRLADRIANFEGS